MWWFLLLTLTFSVNAQSQGGKNNGQCKKVCMTKECIEESNRLFEYMNPKADPCVDFENFACGNFQKENQIPGDRPYLDQFNMIEDKIFEEGRDLLEKEDDGHDYKTDQLIKDFYKSCMNQEKIEERGLDPVKKTLKEMGGMPVLEGGEWDPDKNHWYDVDVKYCAAGLRCTRIVPAYSHKDEKNLNRRKVYLGIPEFGLDRKFLIKGFSDKDVQHYYNFMVESAILLGAKEDVAREEMKDALMFEIGLAKITPTKVEMDNEWKKYTPIKLREFPDQPGFPPSWVDHFNKLILSTGVDTIKIHEDDTIILWSSSFVSKLPALVTNTCPRAIANYQGWRAFQEVIPLLNKAAKALHQKFRKNLRGIEEAEEDWKKCVYFAGFTISKEKKSKEYSLTGAASSMYIRSHLSKLNRKAVESIVQYVRNAFTTKINEADWMDDKTKQKAREKLEGMAQYIAYPDELLNQNKLNCKHKGMQDLVDLDSYYETFINVEKFWRKKLVQAMEEKPKFRFWAKYQNIAAAFVNQYKGENLLLIAGGILQRIFYNPNAPGYLNFGALGSLIGRNLIHEAFDKEGGMKNASGSTEIWWTNFTKVEYNKKAECFRTQYAKYTAKQVGKNLDGNNTQASNIADNGGISASYLAYKNYVKAMGDELPLPGHQWTANQLFWISYGQLYCAKWRDRSLEEHILTSRVAPDEFRIKGPLSNNEDFATDFGCKKPSAMNPLEKCKLF